MGGGHSEPSDQPRQAQNYGYLWYCVCDIDDRWNMDRITLMLSAPQSRQETRFYVVGDIG